MRGERQGPGLLPDLGKALRRVAKAEVPGLLVAIPDIFTYIPPAKFRWERWLAPERTKIFDPDITYGNAFVSRPDFYGVPFGAEYWATMRRIWEGRPVLLVRGDDKRPALFDNASSLELLIGPNRNAWALYPSILARCRGWTPDPEGVVIAALGPTATVLAFDCARYGIQCLDLGKAEEFARKELAQENAA